MHITPNERARMRIKHNVAYELRDAQGNQKQLFSMNKLGKAFLGFVRNLYSPYNADGSRKTGFFANLALYGLRVPGLTGSWQNRVSISNLVTNAGKADVAALINGAAAVNSFDYIAIGTGTTAAAATDTTLVTEITTNGGARAQGTASQQTTDTSNDTARVVLTYNFTGSFAVTESGLLNAASVGTLLCRQVFSAVNVANGDSLQVTWDIDVD